LLFLPVESGVDLIINLLGYYPKIFGNPENYPPDKVIYLPEGNGDIEDMMPKQALSKEFSRLFRNEDGDDFDEHVDLHQPFLEQVFHFSEKNQMPLRERWRDDLAKKFTNQLKSGKYGIDEHHLTLWRRIFSQITGIAKSDSETSPAAQGSFDIVKLRKIAVLIKQKLNFIAEECEEIEGGENLLKEIAKLKKNLEAAEKATALEEILESSLKDRLKKVQSMINPAQFEPEFMREFEAECTNLNDFLSVK
jgi:hypothetical protein